MDLDGIAQRVDGKLRDSRIDRQMVRACETEGPLLTIVWGRIAPGKQTPDKTLVLPFDSEDAARYAKTVVKYGAADLGPDMKPLESRYLNGPVFFHEPSYE